MKASYALVEGHVPRFRFWRNVDPSSRSLAYGIDQTDSVEARKTSDLISIFYSSSHSVTV